MSADVVKSKFERLSYNGYHPEVKIEGDTITVADGSAALDLQCFFKTLKHYYDTYGNFTNVDPTRHWYKERKIRVMHMASNKRLCHLDLWCSRLKTEFNSLYGIGDDILVEVKDNTIIASIPRWIYFDISIPRELIWQYRKELRGW